MKNFSVREIAVCLFEFGEVFHLNDYVEIMDVADESRKARIPWEVSLPSGSSFLAYGDYLVRNCHNGHLCGCYEFSLRKIDMPVSVLEDCIPESVKKIFDEDAFHLSENNFKDDYKKED